MDQTIDQADITQVLGTFMSEVVKQEPGTLLHILRQTDLSMPQLVTLVFVQRCSMASISGISEQLNLSLGATGW